MKKQVRQKNSIVSVSLKDVYAYCGEYTAKFLIDSKISLQCEKIEVKIRNSDGNNLPFTFKRWGTKLNIDFKIDDNVPDGMSVVDVILSGSSKQVKEKFYFWVIKP